MSTLHKSTHSQRLERWLGPHNIEQLSRSMKGWYGPPIHLLDCPGSVRVCGDGDFSGPFERGYFMSAMDSLEVYLKRAWRGMSTPQPSTLNVGFASIADAINQASKGFRQYPGGNIVKVASGATFGFSESMHKVGNNPVAGTAAAAAPGGTVPVDSDTGGMSFSNPTVGTTRLTGATLAVSSTSNNFLLYDRIFAVAKTMNSDATEAVTGVPTRYQSTISTAEDYIGGNFGFVEVGLTGLAATAHNWTVCTYVDQDGNASTLPSLTGAANAPAHRFDHPIQQWFAPLEAGDSGIKAWTQMQSSAAVATGLIDFVIGHPIGFVSFPLANTITPFDWLTNKDQAPRVFDDAYLSFLIPSAATGASTTLSGIIEVTSTSS